MPPERPGHAAGSTCGRPAWWKRLITALFGRSPSMIDYGDWQDPPPDIRVREPRRPRPSSGAAGAVLDPPLLAPTAIAPSSRERSGMTPGEIVLRRFTATDAGGSVPSARGLPASA